MCYFSLKATEDSPSGNLNLLKLEQLLLQMAAEPLVVKGLIYFVVVPLTSGHMVR